MLIYKERMRKIHDDMRDKQISCALLCKPEHIYYLSGYISHMGGLTALLIPKDKDPILIVPEGEMELVHEMSWITDIRGYVAYSLIEKINPIERLIKVAKKVLTELNMTKKTIGIEESFIQLTFHKILKRELRYLRFKDVSRTLEEIRAIKSEEEITCIEKSVNIADLGQKVSGENLEVGITEIEVLVKAKCAMEIEAGGPITVLADLISGPKSALIAAPMVVAGLRKLEKGDLVMIDLSPKVAGYWGDVTRTLVVGAPSAKQEELFEVVLDAGRTAIKAIKPGVKASYVDKMARDFISEAGYGEYFGHHTGHGIGLESYESPMITPYNGNKLREGMVFTIEPGIYIPELGGIRVEDDVVVTHSGSRILSKSKRELLP